MFIWNKVLPVFAGPQEGTGGTSPPPAPPENPTDSNPEKLDSESEWVLGHFDALAADDLQEDVDPEPIAPVDPSKVSPEGEKPEGGEASPSVRTQDAPVVQPALATPVAAQQAQPPAAPPAGAGAPQPALGSAPPAPPSAPDPASLMSQLAEGIAKERDTFVKQLAETQYAISEDDADKLGLTTEQAKFWSLQQARTHVNAVASTTNMQAQHLSTIVRGLIENSNASQKKESEFFSRHPQLSSISRDKIENVLKTVNTLHPDLSGEEWAKKVDSYSSLYLGIQPAASRPNGQIPQQVRTPGPIVRQTSGLPHSPAGSFSAPAPGVAQKSEIETLFELLQRTDSGEFDNH